MKITFTDNNRITEISLSDDNLAKEGEIMIEVSSDASEAWHVFTSLREFEDFYEAVETMRTRLRNHLT